VTTTTTAVIIIIISTGEMVVGVSRLVGRNNVWETESNRRSKRRRRDGWVFGPNRRHSDRQGASNPVDSQPVSQSASQTVGIPNFSTVENGSNNIMGSMDYNKSRSGPISNGPTKLPKERENWN
jgi:hypothetical protein